MRPSRSAKLLLASFYLRCIEPLVRHIAQQKINKGSKQIPAFVENIMETIVMLTLKLLLFYVGCNLVLDSLSAWVSPQLHRHTLSKLANNAMRLSPIVMRGIAMFLIVIGLSIVVFVHHNIVTQ